MSEENKAVVRRAFEELFNRGDLSVADEVFAADFVGHDPALAQDMHGPEEFKHFVRMYRSAFPDLQLTIEDQISDRDEVVTRFTARGTHLGELNGIPPTGRKVVVSGISIDRMVGAKTVESWTSYDLMSMMEQLGVAPVPGASAGAQEQQPRH
ncbi:MAG: ester cyclase [Deltaproteobacteria bacterium]|nr:ester cyclase [Deltaproteobacteria bacterium]MCW5802137.1 ester cyclase [Deltaproteobacteria bacterium]